MSQVNDITYIEEIGILQLYLGTAQLGRDLQRGIPQYIHDFIRVVLPTPVSCLI